MTAARPDPALAEFTVERDTILPPLATLARIVNRKSTLPVLACVRLDALAGNALALDATDLTLHASTAIDARVRTPGTIIVEAKRLHDAIKPLPKGSAVALALTIEPFDPEHPNVERALHVTLTPSTGGTVTLPARQPTDYPKRPAPAEAPCTLPTEALRSALATVAHAMNTDETRYNLNGAMIEAKGGVLRAAATDGHRLAVAQRPISKGAKLPEMILPRRGVTELLRLLGAKDAPVSVKLGWSEAPRKTGPEKERTGGKIAIQVGPIALTVSLIGADFPPWEQTVPRESTHTVTVDRAALLDACKRGKQASADWTYCGTLGAHPDHGALRLRADNAEGAATVIDLLATVEAPAPLVQGFNLGYLVEALAVLDGPTVTLRLGEPGDKPELAPACIRSGGDLFVLMPFRTQYDNPTCYPDSTPVGSPRGRENPHPPAANGGKSKRKGKAPATTPAAVESDASASAALLAVENGALRERVAALQGEADRARESAAKALAETERSQHALAQCERRETTLRAQLAAKFDVDPEEETRLGRIFGVWSRIKARLKALRDPEALSILRAADLIDDARDEERGAWLRAIEEAQEAVAEALVERDAILRLRDLTEHEWELGVRFDRPYRGRSTAQLALPLDAPIAAPVAPAAPVTPLALSTLTLPPIDLPEQRDPEWTLLATFVAELPNYAPTEAGGRDGRGGGRAAHRRHRGDPCSSPMTF